MAGAGGASARTPAVAAHRARVARAVSGARDRREHVLVRRGIAYAGARRLPQVRGAGCRHRLSGSTSPPSSGTWPRRRLPARRRPWRAFPLGPARTRCRAASGRPRSRWRRILPASGICVRAASSHRRPAFRRRCGGSRSARPCRSAARRGCRRPAPGRWSTASAGPGEAETWAVQFEPVDEAGRRLACSVRGVPIKRPSVAGSCFALGRRVFCADPGADGRGCWLVEGPLDALAVCRLDAIGQLCPRGCAWPASSSASRRRGGVRRGGRSRRIQVAGVLGPRAGGAGPGRRQGWYRRRAPTRHGAETGRAAGASSRGRCPVPDWSDLARDTGIEREGIIEY